MKKTLQLFSLLALASAANAATMLVDFGAIVTPGTSPAWNNFTNGAAGTSLALVDTTNSASGATLTINNAFFLLDENPAPSGSYPSTVSEDAFFKDDNASMTLSGLNTSLTYNLTFFAYINRADSRLTNISINGGTAVPLQPGMGTTTGNTITFTNVAPSPTGTIDIGYSRGAGVGNLIINALEITSVPEPSSAMLLGALAICPLLRRRRA